MTSPVLHTERLTLRRPAPSDWEAFRDFMFSDRAQEFGSHRHLGRAFRSFASELGHWDIFGFGMFAVTRRGEDRALALIGPWNPPDWPEREIGWMVLDGAVEGQGIAREAAEGALRHIWATLGWDTVVSYIAEGNARSIALAERLGAVLDPKAKAPEAPGKRVLVFRHPRPEGHA
ncbi:Acetyltransferase, GNAT family [Rubellimicrobium mesophilum DSM 19309]|uniref:Acetyltransferase, GNAT family n=1 Tax=Rubellimicrobium mesophilum DSM 19309 TaxID=442562 RepID=A0A017HW27_9RHOB|nr:GNAT family N-acetyltransferase [Rubellimicrobium mesophilum]EYD77959.1 Acetyltransferase, GNAT family [Rubellimicrobium mesophilum DSM 19309]